MRSSDWSADVFSSDLLFRKRKSPVRTALLITALSLSFAASTLQANEPAPRRASHGPIADAVADAGRTEANRARDSYRHPVETLSFFGVKHSDTIVEIWQRSDERRVGKECARTCRLRGTLDQ